MQYIWWYKKQNYSKSPGLYQQFTNDYTGRKVSFSDIINGNAEASFKISETLMSYNAAYSNTNPYGDATPNRRGFYINLEWLDSVKIKNTFIKLLFLQESVGTGTLKRKNFMLLLNFINFQQHRVFIRRIRAFYTADLCIKFMHSTQKYRA